MKSLKDILTQTGLSSATGRESAAGAAAASPPDDAAESDGEPCQYCAGAGFVRKAVRLGHPDFGKAFPCRCTLEESEEERFTRLQRYSNLGPLSRLTFANLSARGRSPNPVHQERFAAALEAARRFAEEPSGWLVLSGPSGCGKTHLAAAIANRSIEAGRPVLFMVVPDLLDHLRAAYRPDSDVGYDDLFEQVRNTPVLVLDDFGVQSSTPWAEEKLFQLVNHRYGAQMATVFTTNLDLAAFNARLQSRLGDGELSQVYSLESGSSSGMRDLDALDLPLLRDMTFKTFDPRVIPADPDETKDIQDAYRQAMKFAQDPRDWLVIAGETGRGKTRLAAAIGNYCREAGLPVMLLVVPDFLDRLRSSFDPKDARAFDDLFDQVRNVRLLILDDLGSHSGTPWAEEKLFQLINYRYNACLPTVITISCTTKDLNPRLSTRLTDPQVSTVLLMGRFDFFGTRQAVPAPSTRGRGRPARR